MFIRLVPIMLGLNRDAANFTWDYLLYRILKTSRNEIKLNVFVLLLISTRNSFC